MEAKAKRKPNGADAWTTVSDALGFLFQTGYFGRSEYAIPKETQLTIEESEYAFGNSDGFAGEEFFARMSALPCFDQADEADVREILDRRLFHIVCGKTDIPLTALEAVYEMRQKYGIRKFLLLAPDASEREQLCRTISVMQNHFSDKYYGLKLNIMIYNSDNPRQMRTFALSDDIQLLIVNKEYFIRSNNRIKRPSTRLDGLSPVSILRPARCVAITISESLWDVRTVLKYAPLFDPLCTLCFTKNDGDADGIPAVDLSEAVLPEKTAKSDAADQDEDNFHISL